MPGILYGIGVGPGDPELLTVKAVKILRESDVIAIPGKNRRSCVAYGIAVKAVSELEEKECLCLPFPMTRERDKLEESHAYAAERVISCLEQGRNVSFLTLGDSSVYATYLYVHERVKKAGYETVIVSGIPSFCAVAARLNIPLVNGGEELHIIPAAYEFEHAVSLPGVKVFMKAGRKISYLKEVLRKSDSHVLMVENCGMENERLYYSLEEIPDDAGYYSLLIVR